MKTKRLRLLLAKRDGLKCYWCDRPLQMHTHFGPDGRLAEDFATIEHLTPQSWGGRSRPYNTTLACKRCNSSRHHPGWEPKRETDYVLSQETNNH